MAADDLHGLRAMCRGWFYRSGFGAAQRRPASRSQQRVIACMLGLWVLMGIGFISSMLHLGSPMRAFNSLNRVGASALSNEIASGSIFFAVGGIGWLLAMLKKLSPALRTLWLVVTMVLGVVFVWMMVRVYNSIDTVPTWYSIWTPMGFFLTMFMGGPLLGYLLLSLAGVDGWGDGVCCQPFLFWHW